MKIRISQNGLLINNPAFIVSNHISWLDIIALGQYAPSYFVAKSDILQWPIIGYLARQGGTVFIRRGDKNQIVAIGEKMAWLFKQNSHVIAFPEGTTTTGETVLNFHASLFQPAILTQTVIQPVCIEYINEAKSFAPFVGDDEFVAHLLKMTALKTIDIRLTFFPPIQTTGKTRQAVCAESRALIADYLQQDSALQSAA